MHENLKPLGGIYTSVSAAFQRGLFEGGARCLKSSTHDDGVVLEILPLGILRNVRSEYGKQIRKEYETGNIKISRHEFLEKEIKEDGITNTLDSVQKDNLLAIKVKEATKQGYAVARGGAGQRQPYDARKPNKKRESRGRYGEHIRHAMQSRHICEDFGRTYGVCRLVSKERVLYCDPQTYPTRVLPLTRLDR